MKIARELPKHMVDMTIRPDPGHHRHEPLQSPLQEHPSVEGGDEQENGDLTRGDPVVLEQLAAFDTKRARSEASRQRITEEIMDATHGLYMKLINEGEDTLEKAYQLIAEAGVGSDRRVGGLTGGTRIRFRGVRG